jgi:hypothetical protein
VNVLGAALDEGCRLERVHCHMNNNKKGTQASKRKKKRDFLVCSSTVSATVELFLPM